MTPASEGFAKKRILLVDDEDGFRRGLAQCLREAGFAVTEAYRGPDALAFLQAEPCGFFDVVVMDYSLDFGMTGGEAVNEMRRCCPDQPVLYLSGHDLPPDLRRGEAFLQKPAELEEIIREVERLSRAVADTLVPPPPEES